MPAHGRRNWAPAFAGEHKCFNAAGSDSGLISQHDRIFGRFIRGRLTLTRYRDALPQLGGDLFLTDAGLETDLIFNHGIEIREFAAHTLLPEAGGRAAVERYFEGFLNLARETGAGFVLDTTTWKAHRHWSADLGQSPEELRAVNQDAVALASSLRARFAGGAPIVLSATIGPRGDAYRPERKIPADEAEAYYAEQLGWLAP